MDRGWDGGFIMNLCCGSERETELSRLLSSRRGQLGEHETAAQPRLRRLSAHALQTCTARPTPLPGEIFRHHPTAITSCAWCLNILPENTAVPAQKIVFPSHHLTLFGQTDCRPCPHHAYTVLGMQLILLVMP